MKFTESISTCLKKTLIFEGRASLSEFWWFQLIVISSIWIADYTDPSVLSLFFLIITLLALLTSVSAAVRRLHDTNKSGVFLSIIFIPFIGIIILIFFLIATGTKGKNKYGASPSLKPLK
jgi:uncharacterized membrane protein YhaH (DUF805 family)